MNTDTPQTAEQTNLANEYAQPITLAVALSSINVYNPTTQTPVAVYDDAALIGYTSPDVASVLLANGYTINAELNTLLNDVIKTNGAGLFTI